MILRGKILIAAREPESVKLLEAYLVSNGYETATVFSGDQVLAVIAQGDIDLVLLDVAVPGSNGFEVTRRIRSNPATRFMPIVLLTAFSESEDRTKGIQAGCDDFISEPFDKSEVLTRVETLLNISAARSLLDEKEKFDYVLNHIDAAILVLDRDLRVIHLNQTTRNLLSLPPGDPSAFNFFESLREQFRARFSGDLKIEITQKPLSFDIEREETGELRPLVILFKSNLVRNPLGEVGSVVVLMQDVTEERRKEFEARNFITLISHKLRTLITVVKGNVSLLSDEVLGALNEKQKKAARTADQRAGELVRMIEKILCMTAVQGQRDQQQSWVDISQAISKIVESFKAGKPNCEIELKWNEFHDELKLAVEENHLRVILENLLENAVKFSDKDAIKIIVSCQKVNQDLRIDVSDNGPGIPSEEKEKIFKVFYQIDKHRTGNVEGAGLGLAIVKELITSYGGSVEVQSASQKGSTFILHFPITRPH